MAILYTLLVGLVVGLLAKLLVPGKDPGGLFVTAIIGIAGAFVAKEIIQYTDFSRQGEVPGFIASVLGAVLLLVVYKWLTR